MAGYLDAYGVADARRERLLKRIAIWGLAVVVAATIGFFTFHNWREERVMDHFVSLLKDKNYQEAYKLWGCTPETPCQYYPPEKFTEDWGPAGKYKDAAAMKVEDVDACNAGVVFNIAYPGDENFGLWVERSTKVLSYAPWTRCPGPHLQIVEQLKRRFGGGR
jgi:hypothetical protein